MRAWFARVYWKLQGRRQVRLQLAGDSGAIDGILVGIIAGHYRLVNAYFYAHVPNAQGEELLGETWILKERVFLLNVKPS